MKQVLEGAAGLAVIACSILIIVALAVGAVELLPTGVQPLAVLLLVGFGGWWVTTTVREHRAELAEIRAQEDQVAARPNPSTPL